MKRYIIILISILVVILLGVGIFVIISMNNTITTLNKKIDSQASQPKLSPEPTINHDTEISELMNLYNQKDSLIQGYYDKANSIKATYSKDKDFAATYAIASTNFDKALSGYNNIKSNIKKFNATILSAALCAVYDTYAEEQSQVLLNAKGIIDILKIEYSDSQYNEAESLLESIVELDI